MDCLSEPRRGQKQIASFDLAQYMRSRFQMFGGDEVRVTLRCAKAMQNTKRERVGTGPIFVEEPDGHFHFDTNIVVSPPFFGWVMGFGGQVEILHPQSVRGSVHPQRHPPLPGGPHEVGGLPVGASAGPKAVCIL